MVYTYKSQETEKYLSSCFTYCFTLCITYCLTWSPSNFMTRPSNFMTRPSNFMTRPSNFMTRVTIFGGLLHSLSYCYTVTLQFIYRVMPHTITLFFQSMLRVTWSESTYLWLCDRAGFLRNAITVPSQIRPKFRK